RQNSFARTLFFLSRVTFVVVIHWLLGYVKKHICGFEFHLQNGFATLV
ncbi:unnamed protein product, partial [Brassica rapa]